MSEAATAAVVRAPATARNLLDGMFFIGVLNLLCVCGGCETAARQTATEWTGSGGRHQIVRVFELFAADWTASTVLDRMDSAPS
ncbi:hypothetical protein BCR44DRAFT_1426209 [Catenaria anguillulae PL171]|uniref:Uncharacterized protein n=1 Tax=Catenaria anguillulae PL171 TaxID=765915 RepID=A0A1Y2HZQ5_9FUNG|nr:hypothetical protein BCR44DRAFT_1426209 [Catenaria anguillulae PL171]